MISLLNACVQFGPSRRPPAFQRASVLPTSQAVRISVYNGEIDAVFLSGSNLIRSSVKSSA